MERAPFNSNRKQNGSESTNSFSLYRTELSGAKAHKDQGLLSLSVYVTLGAGVHEQMFRSSGQSEENQMVFSSQANLVLIYPPTEGMKG
ncbi:hypothetical protein TNCV_3105171 [Trichonephila clavipes]|nr:hypothetical protein TNCV_3105171 [Trichonephila clavipes]